MWKLLSNEISSKYVKTDIKSKSVSFSLTEISGGSSHNVTPQKCKITIDIRVPNGVKCLEVLDYLDNSIKNGRFARCLESENGHYLSVISYIPENVF